MNIRPPAETFNQNQAFPSAEFGKRQAKSPNTVPQATITVASSSAPLGAALLRLSRWAGKVTAAKRSGAI